METIQIQSPNNGRVAAIISYFTIIGWLIAYFALYKNKKTDFAGFHLRQSLLFAIVAMLLGWGLVILLTILINTTGFKALGIIGTAVQILLLIMWLIGLIGAITGRKTAIPLVGKKAQQLFSSI
jgi:uncharacterized membrane protein